MASPIAIRSSPSGLTARVGWWWIGQSSHRRKPEPVPAQPMARRYVRDARGRFASGGYQGQTSGRGSRLGAPGRSARRGSTIRAAAPAATVSRSGRGAGGAPKAGTSNAIRPTSGRSLRRAPLGLKANAVRAFNPKSPRLQIDQLERQADRAIRDLDREMKRFSDAVKSRRPKIDAMKRQLERQNARAMQQRLGKDPIDRMLAGVELGVSGTKAGAKAIKRRMQRAAAAADRGSKPAARAREIYGNQMAYMGTGKPKAARNNLRPGPRNTQGPPKRRRGRRR